MEAWLHVDNTSDFTIYNIPFGIGSTGDDSTKFVATAIGNYVINLAVLEEANLFDGLLMERVFNQDSVNAFISQGKDVWSKVRKQIQFLLGDTQSPLKNDEKLQQRAIFNRREITMHQPLKVNDYTDFYASKHHAVNVGTIFRGPGNALMPNWTHLPIVIMAVQVLLSQVEHLSNVLLVKLNCRTRIYQFSLLRVNLIMN